MLLKKNAFFLATIFSINFCVAAPKRAVMYHKRPNIFSNNDNRYQQLLHNKLEKGYKTLAKQYEPVLKAYTKLLQATPAEYFCYYNELKVTILREMSENHFGYRSGFTRGLYNFCLPWREEFLNNENAIREFRHHIAPWNVLALKKMITGVMDQELVDKAIKLKDSIVDIMRIMA